MFSSSQVCQWPLPSQPLSFSTRDGDFRNGDGDYRARDPRICFRGAARVIQGAFLQEVFECLVPVGSLATSGLPPLDIRLWARGRQPHKPAPSRSGL